MASPSQIEIESAQVQEQLKRLLKHPLFHRSERYPALLQYVVEQTLLGNGDQLKERSIGIEVFGRPTDYDPSSDPIVRFTASEVRKRLAQYYIDPEHNGELQIDLHAGSYAAVFHSTAISSKLSPSEFEQTPTVAADVQVIAPLTEQSAPPSPIAIHRRLEVFAKIRYKNALVIIVGLCLGLGIFLHTLSGVSRHETQKADSLDQFWAPLTTGSGMATISIGENASANPTIKPSNAPPGSQEHLRKSAYLAISDVVVLTHVGVELESRHKPFRVAASPETTFPQLREGPVILIGGFNNVWSVRVTKSMRFGFVAENGIGSIVDSHDSGHVKWSIPWRMAYPDFSHDYAIVARFHDPTIGQPVVIAAGIGDAGTESAGEFISNPDYFGILVQQAPRNWPSMNMEAVIETVIVDGHPGPPHILAVEFW